MEAERRLRAWVTHRWWKQVGLELEGVRTAVRSEEAEADMAEEAKEWTTAESNECMEW